MPNLITVSAVVGLLGVALGAFGAHGLETQLEATPEQLEWWRTATFYHLVHVVPLLGIGVLQEQRPGGNRAGQAFLIGILLFSGSLYAMGLGAPKWFGAVTPFGGLALMAGWGLLAFYGARGKRAGGT